MNRQNDRLKYGGTVNNYICASNWSRAPGVTKLMGDTEARGAKSSLRTMSFATKVLMWEIDTKHQEMEWRIEHLIFAVKQPRKPRKKTLSTGKYASEVSK